MLKFGKVTDIDAARGLARVAFMEDDGIVSDWLPVIVPKAKDDSYSFMFDINEHVACMMDEHCENGVVLGAIYDSKRQPDGGNADKVRVKFSDNTVIEYDRAAHKLYAEVKGSVHVIADTEVLVECANATVQASGNITATCHQAAITAQLVTVDAPNMIVTGVLQAGSIQAGGVGGGSGNVQINGSLIVDGSVAAQGDVTAGAISLMSHVHGGVESGGATTAGPQ